MFYRTDKCKSTKTEISEEEVRNILKGTYKDVDVIIQSLKKGDEVQTAFSIFTYET